MAHDLPAALAGELPEALRRSDSERYEKHTIIGQGASGTVWRVRDRQLQRWAAMKILEPGKRLTREKLMRFIEEAQATAQLHHPAIVPVHEMGMTDDGRVFFTMEEIKGRTLAAIVQSVHDASPEVWGRTADGWTLRRLVEAFRTVCEAVAYAHSRGVVHRDLKPDNVMIGTFGDIRVMDWGIAKVLGSEDTIDVLPEPGDEPVATARVGEDAFETRLGAVAGTPHFMAPEQARGDSRLIDRRTDVYSLGSVLYYILKNDTPFAGDTAMKVLYQVALKQPQPLEGRPDGPVVPKALVTIVKRAMQREKADRYADAAALADDIAHWLDGAERREAAMRAIEEASVELRKATTLQRRVRKLRRQADRLLQDVPSWAPDADKETAWRLQDEAAELAAEARLHDLASELQMNAAFAHTPELPEAHLALARRYQKQHKQAEEERNLPECERLEWLLRRHLAHLPPDWPGRERIATYVEGAGTLSLTSTPESSVVLFAYRPRRRRLGAAWLRDLAPTPLNAGLPMGSYLLELTAPGHAKVRYPLEIRRGTTWEGDIVLPGADDLGPDDVFVPAGWFRAGGDRLARHSLPATRLFVPTFVMKRFPVTVGEYAAWLDGLAPADADVHRPRTDDGDWLEFVADDLPVTGVTWNSARLYALDRADETNLWRLPSELEWEKAARGVDGRFWPWGDASDPSWCNQIGARSEGDGPVPVTAFRDDISPYGVRGMAGNVEEWCADAFVEGGQLPEDGHVTLDFTISPTRHRVLRGGSFRDEDDGTRCAGRLRAAADYHSEAVGFRLCRSLES